MHPDIAQAVAEARIADLHRDAAHRRLARQATPRRTGIAARKTWTRARTATSGWITARTQARVPTNPACCPA